MTRRRNLKSFVYDPRIQTLDHVAFRLYWNIVSDLADSHGRMSADPEMVAGAAFWGLHGTAEKVTAVQVQDAIAELDKRGLVAAYHVNGRDYVEVCDWERDQVVRRPGSRSKFPGPKEATVALVSAEMGRLKASLMEEFAAVWSRYHQGAIYPRSHRDYVELGDMLAVMKRETPELIPALPALFLAYVKDRDDTYYMRRRHLLQDFCRQGAAARYSAKRGVVTVVSPPSLPQRDVAPVDPPAPTPEAEAWPDPPPGRRRHLL